VRDLASAPSVDVVMSSLRCSIVLCAGLIAETVPAVTAEAGPINLITNGSFTSFTNNNGQSTVGEGFQPDYNGTITGWSNSNANGGGAGTGGDVGYNFLFLSNTGTTAPADIGAYGVSAGLTLWDQHSAGNGWNGQGPGNANYLALDGDYETGSISQTLTGLTKGTVYEVTFNYAFAQQNGYTGNTIDNLQVNFGSRSSSVGSYNFTSKGFSGWQTATMFFEADGTSDVLSFLAIGNVQLPPFALLTNIAAYAAPEPATYGILAIGLASVITAARRRRARVAAAVA